ncbi:MAG: hypothetical protein LBJ69_02455 [Holosporales bacterium]|jgi:hypothetical protein|nr:hypothetical protein [Holosporales bacterium]
MRKQAIALVAGIAVIGTAQATMPASSKHAGRTIISMALWEIPDLVEPEITPTVPEIEAARAMIERSTGHYISPGVDTGAHPVEYLAKLLRWHPRHRGWIADELRLMSPLVDEWRLVVNNGEERLYGDMVEDIDKILDRIHDGIPVRIGMFRCGDALQIDASRYLAWGHAWNILRDLTRAYQQILVECPSIAVYAAQRIQQVQKPATQDDYTAQGRELSTFERLSEKIRSDVRSIKHARKRAPGRELSELELMSYIVAQNLRYLVGVHSTAPVAALPGALGSIYHKHLAPRKHDEDLPETHRDDDESRELCSQIIAASKQWYREQERGGADQVVQSARAVILFDEPYLFIFQN